MRQCNPNFSLIKDYKSSFNPSCRWYRVVKRGSGADCLPQHCFLNRPQGMAHKDYSYRLLLSGVLVWKIYNTFKQYIWEFSKRTIYKCDWDKETNKDWWILEQDLNGHRGSGYWNLESNYKTEKVNSQQMQHCIKEWN